MGKLHPRRPIPPLDSFLSIFGVNIPGRDRHHARESDFNRWQIAAGIHRVNPIVAARPPPSRPFGRLVPHPPGARRGRALQVATRHGGNDFLAGPGGDQREVQLRRQTVAVLPQNR